MVSTIGIVIIAFEFLKRQSEAKQSAPDYFLVLSHVRDVVQMCQRRIRVPLPDGPERGGGRTTVFFVLCLRLIKSTRNEEFALESFLSVGFNLNSVSFSRIFTILAKTLYPFRGRWAILSRFSLTDYIGEESIARPEGRIRPQNVLYPSLAAGSKVQKTSRKWPRFYEWV